MSLFGHKVLDNKDIIKRSFDYKYSNYNSTIGYNFNGSNIIDKNDYTQYFSIVVLPEFKYASFEELHLADYEKTQTGNIEKYKIIDTSGKNGENTLKNQDFGEISFSPNINNIYENNNNQTNPFFLGTTQNTVGLFGNTTPTLGGLFGNLDTQGGGLFGNSKTQGGGLFGNNNTQGGGLFGNTNTTQTNGGLFGNSNTQGGGLFGNTNTQGGGLFGNSNTQGGGLFGNNNATQTTEGLFGNTNTQGGGLFGNSNTQGGGLFGNNNTTHTTEGLFGNNNTTHTTEELFGNNNTAQTTEGLFGNNSQTNGGGLFSSNNNQNIEGMLRKNQNNTNSNNNKNIFGLLQNNNEVIDRENNLIIIPRNNMKKLLLNNKKKCIHENDFTSYNIEKEDNESGLLCYNCLYKYYKNNIQNCIPIKDNNFENYKKFYKECINKYKLNVEKIFKEIISEIEKYENEEIDNISTLFDEKVDLKFKLPVEVPFIERFEIAINRKIISLLDNKLFNSKINHNCVNLFQNEIKELKFKKNNPNEKESIKIRSSIDFNIFGIALPKMPENEGNDIEMNLISDNNILNKITNFENYENLSIGLFDTNIIKINKNTDYYIEIKGIKNLDYISNEEEYNENTKLEINSNNQETILTGLIIE